METTDAFLDLACRDCGGRHAPEDADGRCPDCGGVLDAEYDLDAVEAASLASDAGPASSMWDYDALLPFSRGHAVSLGEGGTPLVDCQQLAGELGVASLLVKDEGQNPTGSTYDRGTSLALTAALVAGETDVALPSAGNDGHAAAAYAARAGLGAHVFVPSRAGFVQKAMINVHGGDMTVVEGRLPEASARFASALAEHDEWCSIAPFETPYRHEGAKTVLYEVVAALGGAPDAVVFPAGEGAGLVAAYKAATELERLGVVDERPRLYAAQASGCAPIVEAVESGGPVESWDVPDTICGDIEVPDPAGGDWAVEAVRETGGGAVATDDPDVLESAVTMAEHEGVASSPSGAAAASGAWALAERGEFDANETVVVVNAATGTKTADVLRSHLMGKGV